MTLKNHLLLWVAIVTASAFSLFGILQVELSHQSRLRDEISLSLQQEQNLRRMILWTKEQSGSSVSNQQLYIRFMMEGFSVEIYDSSGNLSYGHQSMVEGPRPELEIGPQQESHYILRRSSLGPVLYISSWIELLDEPHLLVSRKGLAEVFRLRKSEYLRFFLLLFACLLVLFLLLSWTIKRTTSSLQNLSHAVDQTMTNRWAKDLPTKGPSDIVNLGRAFDELGQRVSEQFQEIQDNLKRNQDFQRSMAHEINTPLTQIVGYAQEIGQQELDPAELQNYADRIVQQGEYLTGLSRMLRGIFLLQEEKIPKESIATQWIIKGLQDSCAFILKNKGLILKVHGDPLTLWGQKELLLAALINLVQNGIKASTPGHSIELNIKEDSSIAVMTMENSLAEGHSDNEALEEGLGVGHFLVRKIMELHQGQFEFYIRNKHAIARLIIPLKEEDSP